MRPAPDPKPKKNRELKTTILPIPTPTGQTPAILSPIDSTKSSFLNPAAIDVTTAAISRLSTT